MSDNNVNLTNDLEERTEGILYKNFKRGLIFYFFPIFVSNFWQYQLLFNVTQTRIFFIDYHRHFFHLCLDFYT